ncbi:hypothetical protein ABPG77_004250 [Micractinium sp. CCAP 211/92]
MDLIHQQGGEHPQVWALLASALLQGAPPNAAASCSADLGACSALPCPSQGTQPPAGLPLVRRLSASPPPVPTPQVCEKMALLQALMERQRRTLRQQQEEQDEWAAAARVLLRHPGSAKRKREALLGQGISPGQAQSTQPHMGGHGEVSLCIAEVQRQAAHLDQQRLCHLAIVMSAAVAAHAPLPAERPKQAISSLCTTQPLACEPAALLAAALQLDSAASKPVPDAKQEPPASLFTAAASLLNDAAVRQGSAPRPSTPVNNGDRSGRQLQKRDCSAAAAGAWMSRVQAASTARATDRQRQWAALFSFFRSQLLSSTG